MHVDGRLTEAVWQGAGTDDFTQRNPLDGKPASERTEVWVAFDDKALYVAARLYDSEPAKIVGLLGRRDDELDSDWFTFAVDPYLDRRSGFPFSVNPAGSIIDRTLYNDEWNDSHLGRDLGERGPASTNRAGPWRCAFPTTSCASPSAANTSGGSISSAPSSARTSRTIFPGCPRRRTALFRASPA